MPVLRKCARKVKFRTIAVCLLSCLLPMHHQLDKRDNSWHVVSCGIKVDVDIGTPGLQGVPDGHRYSNLSDGGEQAGLGVQTIRPGNVSYLPTLNLINVSYPSTLY